MKTRRSISQGRLGSASSVIPTLSASAGRSATGLDSARLGPFGTGGWFWGSACTGAFSSPLLILLTPPIFWPLWDKGASFQSLTPAVSQRQPFASRDLRWIFFYFPSLHMTFSSLLFILFWHLEQGKKGCCWWKMENRADPLRLPLPPKPSEVLEALFLFAFD